MAESCNELPRQAERSRSESAHVRVCGTEMVSIGVSSLAASDTVTNLWALFALQVRTKSVKKSKMPVLAHWCSPKVSKSMKRLTSGAELVAFSSAARYFETVRGYSGHLRSEKRKAMSSESW